MLTKEAVLKLAKKRKRVLTMDLVKAHDVSRQYASEMLSGLVRERKLIKIGSTKNSFYVLPEHASEHGALLSKSFRKTYKNTALEEHRVLDEILRSYEPLGRLPENVMSIFTYAFSEMFNNAIEHSHSKRISVEVEANKKTLMFTVNDLGVGVFRNIMRKKNLRSELEAIQELMKGKTTTMPRSHSGEGIFFTSRAADVFELGSFGHKFIVNNELPDIFVEDLKRPKKGTGVLFQIATKSKRSLNELFREYAGASNEGGYGFDRTQIFVKLYTIGGVHISRSQARRALSGLEKFKHIVFDFSKVPMIGQAFADEIFRVFHSKYPAIKLEAVNMNDSVAFMIERAR